MATTPRPARYLAIAADIRAKIADETYAVGSTLPSTARLSESYEVSATVIQRALSELKHEGLLEGQPGKAVYVVAMPDKEHRGGVDYLEVIHEIESLRSTVDDVFTQLDKRVSELEKAARHRRTPRGGP